VQVRAGRRQRQEERERSSAQEVAGKNAARVARRRFARFFSFRAR